MTILSKPAGPFTRADLDALPDDGYRHELLDGMLIVSPSPLRRHQRVVGELFVILHGACPREFELLVSPFDVALAADTVLEPDILVAHAGDTTERDLPVAPALAVEVLSPSTRRYDLTLKRSRYEAAGTASYWVVDPDPEAPRLIAWDLVDGKYEQVADVGAGESWTAVRPYSVVIEPARLV